MPRCQQHAAPQRVCVNMLPVQMSFDVMNAAHVVVPNHVLKNRKVEDGHMPPARPAVHVIELQRWKKYVQLTKVLRNRCSFKM